MLPYLEHMAKSGFFVGLIRDGEHYELAALAGLALIVAVHRPDVAWIQELCVRIAAVAPFCMMVGNPAKRDRWQWPVPHPHDPLDGRPYAAQ